MQRLTKNNYPADAGGTRRGRARSEKREKHGALGNLPVGSNRMTGFSPLAERRASFGTGERKSVLAGRESTKEVQSGRIRPFQKRHLLKHCADEKLSMRDPSA